MKRNIILICVIFTLCLYSVAFAVQMRLTIESYPTSTLPPSASKIIDIPDVDDQLEISRQAALFALSQEGWDLGNLLGAVLGHVGPLE